MRKIYNLKVITMKGNKHVGVYGLVRRDDQILVIKKSRGPYKGFYDLPGGGIEFNENLEDALKREFNEEIGVDIDIEEQLANVDYSSEWLDDGVLTNTHHVGLYYKVRLLSDKIKLDPDGHDSEGALWLSLNDVSAKNISPIVYKMLKRVGII